MKRRSFLTTAFAAACAYAAGPVISVTPSPDIDAIMASLQATVRKTWENRVRLAYAQMAFTDSANTPPNTPDDSIPPPY